MNWEVMGWRSVAVRNSGNDKVMHFKKKGGRKGEIEDECLMLDAIFEQGWKR